MSPLKRIYNIVKRLNSLPEKVAEMQLALGRLEQRQIAAQGLPIGESEFKVFSQWGEDGIIQFLIRHVPIDRRLFVEFGVENYTEANTRYLVLNDLWAGLVIDGSEDNIAELRRDPIYWSNNIKAECAFITRDNIDELITRSGITGDIGLLSVDIDGNDYWVWEAITSVSPRIVICEYNSLFGPTACVTTPYDPTFVRARAHHSRVYYGASIAALARLAGDKGYSLVAGNAAGNNVFFVRNDLVGSLDVLQPAEAYRESRFREAHDAEGRLTFADFRSRLDAIGSLDVHDLDTGTVRPLRDVPGVMPQ